MKIRRVILIVLDGVGVGELPDAGDFGDIGSNTLKHVSYVMGGLNLPNLQRMGLGNITDIKGINSVKKTIGAYGKMIEISKGKDTLIGHWELAGIYSSKPLPLFPKGFPQDLISKFEEQTSRKVLGNKAASGTEIIKQLGDEHVQSGKLIVYTSADSVFQVAAHEDIIPISELYQICKIARKMLNGKYSIGRVIARPFLGTSGKYWRTKNRKDWSLIPPSPNLLEKLFKAGYDVITVGKIDEIFAFRNITVSAHTVSNQESIDNIIKFLNTEFHGLLFANLIEFDMLYGHRNDPDGYAKALKQFDDQIPNIMNAMKSNDILIITSDHGNDPVTISTDHSREYVPLLVYGKSIKTNIDLKTRSTFADVGASIADLFYVSPLDLGTSFFQEIY